MQHWSVIQRLVAGDLFYEDEGLLDRTHLRWFTRATLTAMLRPRRLSRGHAARPVSSRKAVPRRWAMRDYAAALALDPAVAVRDADVMQWLLLAEATQP